MARRILVALLIAMVPTFLALVNLVAFAGPMQAEVAGAKVVRAAYIVTCTGLLICSSIVFLTWRPRQAAQKHGGLKHSLVLRILIVLFLLPALWTAIGSAVIRGAVMTFSVSGPEIELGRVAETAKSVGDRYRIRHYPGGESQVIIRRGFEQEVRLQLALRNLMIKEIR